MEEILTLSRADQAKLFALLRERPTLRRYLSNDPPPAEREPAAAAPKPVESDCTYLLIFDGGSRGNPGEGYGSYVLYRTDSGQKRIERLEFPGRMTNNEAEYETLISALETLLEKIRERGLDPSRYSIEVRGDSQLVIFQLLGKWKAKDARMAAYRDHALRLLSQFGRYRLTHHRREKSVEALGH
jgi:ribonuclease HI